MKEMGWNGFSVDTARAPLTNMGQTLFEPPNVAGWQLGTGWFGTGAMLARMNFAATLAANQKFNLARSFSAAPRPSPTRCSTPCCNGCHAGAACDQASRSTMLGVSREPARRGPDRRADEGEGAGPGPAHRRVRRISVRCRRRQTWRHRLASRAAIHSRRRRRRSRSASPRPPFLVDIARAQGAVSRNLVVIYLRRRQRRAEHRDAVHGSVLLQPPAHDRRARRAGAADRQRLDRASALGLHPRLTGLQTIFNQGRLAIVQRTGYAELEPVALPGARHLGHRRSRTTQAERDGSDAISTRCRRRRIRCSDGTRRRSYRAR